MRILLRALTRLVPVTGVAIALGGCPGPMTPGTIDTASINPPDFVPGLPKGYQCPLVPNGFDPAGSIYRLDKSGTYYRVKDYSKDPAITASGTFKSDVPISNYVLSDKQASTAGLSFEIMKAALPGLTAAGSTDFSKEISIDITVEDMVGEVIDDTVADKIVSQFQKDIEPKAGSKYYLVRETVKAGAVSYRLRQTDVAKLGGKAEIEKLAEGKANVTVRDNAGAFEIKQKFSPDRIPICIKSAEIVVDAVRAGRPDSEVTVSLKSTEETTVPTIKRVGEN